MGQAIRFLSGLRGDVSKLPERVDLSKLYDNARTIGERLDAAIEELAAVRNDPQTVSAFAELLAELDGFEYPATSPEALKRAAGRLRLLRRFGELRSAPANRGVADHLLFKAVADEASQIAPGVECSVRSLQRWVKDWNTIGPDGLAHGLAAVLDRRGRPLGAVSNRV